METRPNQILIQLSASAITDQNSTLPPALLAAMETQPQILFLLEFTQTGKKLESEKIWIASLQWLAAYETKCGRSNEANCKKRAEPPERPADQSTSIQIYLAYLVFYFPNQLLKWGFVTGFGLDIKTCPLCGFLQENLTLIEKLKSINKYLRTPGKKS